MRLTRNLAGALLLGGACLATPSMAAFNDVASGNRTADCTDAGDLATLGINQPECQVLEAFWNATAGADGTGWTEEREDENGTLAAWGTVSNVSTWLGVTVSGGHVTQLTLRDHNLSGALPTTAGSTLGDLPSLTRLDLPYNNITGGLSSLAGLEDTLEILLLGNNQLTADLSDIQTFTNLTRLNLNHSPDSQGNVTGDLSAVAGLVHLTQLDLSHQQITGDLANIAALDSLETLVLMGNNIHGDIAAFAGASPMSAMKTLVIGDNGISGGDQITGNISALAQMPNLEIVDMRHNSVSGNLSSLSGLSNLTRLWLGGNQVSGDLSSLSGLTNLMTLYVHQNDGITGDLSQLNNLWLASHATGPAGGEFENTNTGLNISGNGLYFSNIEPAFTTFNDGSPSDFGYDSTQLADGVDLVDTARTIYFNQTLTITPAVPENTSGNDSYQWSKDGDVVAGATDRIFTKNNATAADAGNYTYDVTNSVVTNLTLRSRTITTVFDDTPPATPGTTPDLTDASDSANTTDNITNVQTPEFGNITCTDQPGGSTVQLYIDGTASGAPFHCTAAGTHVLTAASLADGTHEITYREIDAAGNMSADSASLTITVDTAISLGVSEPTGTITDTTPHFEGTGDSGDKITVTGSGSSCSTTVAADGSWSCDVAPALANDTIVTFLVKAEDTAGNSRLISHKVTIGSPIDSDGDGVLDIYDAFPDDPNETVDTDNDGTGNNADPDDDDDGFSDQEEIAAGTDPLNAASYPGARTIIAPLLDLLLM